MKTKPHHKILNFLLLIPLIGVILTVFIVCDDFTNSTIYGKRFGFYAFMSFLPVSTILTLAINKKKTKISILDILFLIFIFVSVAYSYMTLGVITTKLRIFILLAILYFFVRIHLQQYSYSKHCILYTILLSGLIEAIWGLTQLYGLSSSYHDLFKLTGSFFNPGPYAGYLSMILPISLFYLLNDYRFIKNKYSKAYFIPYLRWSISFLTFICILLVLPATMSRASWIGAILGCTVVLLQFFLQSKSVYIKRNKKKRFYGCILLIAGLIISCLGLYSLKKDSADGRVFIWKISLSIIKQHPCGVGLGRFPGAYSEAQISYFESKKGTTHEQNIAEPVEYAFNEYIQLCTEFGIGALMLFLTFLTASLYYSIKIKNHAESGALISLLIFASMSYPFRVLPLAILLIILLATNTSSLNIKPHFFYANKKLYTYIIIFILTITTYSSISNSYSSYQAHKSWGKAKELYRSNAFKKGAEEYAQLYSYLNNDISFMFEYARCLSKSYQFKESNQIIHKALKISCDPMFYNIMGKNYQDLKEYSAAESYFLKSSSLVPNRIYPYYLLGKLYYTTKAYEKAYKMTQVVNKKKPKVSSPAINEMKDEINQLYKKYK